MSVKKTKRAASAGKKKSLRQSSGQAKKANPKTSRKASSKSKAQRVQKTVAAKNKKPEPKIQKDIKKAVEHIPKLILEERERVGEQKRAERKTTSSNKPNNSINTNYTSRSYKKRSVLMWLGVILLTLFVFIMWFLNTRSTLYDINKNENKETKIWDNSKEKLEEILEGIDLEKLTPQDTDKSDANLIDISTAKLNLLIKAISDITSTTTTTFNSSSNKSPVQP